jgi:hypothetical protein
LLEEGLGVEVDLTTRKGLHPLIHKRVEAEATRVFLMASRSPLLRVHDMLESYAESKKPSPAKLSATTSAPGFYGQRWSEVLR